MHFTRAAGNNNFFGGVDPSTQSEETSSSTISLLEPAGITVGAISAGTSLSQYDNIQSLLEAMFYPYVSPSVTISSNISTSVIYETDVDSIAQPVITMKFTKGTNDLQRFILYRDNVSVLEQTIESGVTTYTYNDSGTYTANVTYKVVVYDVNSKTSQASISYTFASPVYYGVTTSTLEDLTADNITAMTKQLSTSKTFTTTNTGSLIRCVIAVPSSYTLSKAIDQNSFDITSTFSYKTLTVVGKSYKVYANSPSTLSGFKITYTFS